MSTEPTQVMDDLPTAPGPAIMAGRIAAVCTAGAAAIHIGVAGEHFAQWWLFGAFFLALAAVQMALAFGLWTPGRAPRLPWVRLLAASAVVNGLTLLLWLLTRTTGLPFGPEPGQAEPFGLADVVCGLLELAALGAAIAGVRWRARAATAAATRPMRHAGAVLAATVAAALVASGVAIAAPGEHAQADHAESSDHQSPHVEGSGHGNGERHEMPNLPDVSGATAAETSAAGALLTSLEHKTARYRDPAVAQAAGYDIDQALARWQRKRPGKTLGVVQALHVPNKAARNDGRLVDADAPETLIYHRSADGQLTLEGVMFTAERKAPPSVYEPYLRWHFHANCVGPDGKRVEPSGDQGGSTCPAGTKLATSGYMAHVWFVQPDDLVHAFALGPPRAALRAALML